MGDTNPVQDIKNEVVDVKDAIQDLLKDSEKFKDINKDLLDAKGNFSDLGKELVSATKDFGGYIQKMGESSAVSALFTRNMSEAMLQLNALGIGALKTSNAFDVFKTSLDGTGVFANASGSYKALTDQMAALGISAKDTSTVYGKLFSAIDKYGTKFMDNATAGQALEAGMISMASASGELGTKLGVAGENFERIPNLAVQYSDRIGLVAKSTGLSTKNINDFVHQMSEVPGAFNTVATVGAGTGKVMTSVSGALALAAASGRDQKEVLTDLKEAYVNLNLSADKALEYTALIGESSSRLGLRIKDTDEYFGALIKNFKYLGNEAGDNQNVMEGVANTLQRYSGALKDTGLSSKATTDLIADMTKSIGGMDTATKAFLANRSGLGGGLQGAFKIDLLQKQGKTDEIVKMIEEDLKKQFGGRIVTLEQAASNSDSAAQYQKQLAMINQGAYKQFLGGGPEADQKAGRLFEALASGKVGEAGKALTGQEALASAVDKGTTLQQRQVTELTKIQADTERAANLQAIVAAGTLRNTFGTGADRNNKQREDLLKSVNDAMSLATHVDLPTERGETGGAGKKAGEAYGDLAKDLVSAGGGVSNLKDIFGTSVESIFAEGKMTFDEQSKISSARQLNEAGKKVAGKQVANRNTTRTVVDNAIKNRNQPTPNANVTGQANKTNNKENTRDLSHTFTEKDIINIVIHHKCSKCGKEETAEHVQAHLNDAVREASTQTRPVHK